MIRTLILMLGIVFTVGLLVIHLSGCAHAPPPWCKQTCAPGRACNKGTVLYRGEKFECRGSFE